MDKKIKIIACRTVENEIKMFKLPEVETLFLESAYHRFPDKLRDMLQSCIDNEKEADVVAFGFGLCSNGLAGLYSRDKTLVIPRAHDCISLLLGSKERYEQEFKAEPGTYYLSKGWIDELRDPYSEYLEYVEKYGRETAEWVIKMQYHNYTRVALIYNTPSEADEYKEFAVKVADFLNAKFETIQAEGKLLEKLFSGEWDEKDFVVIPPGGKVKTKNFL